MLPQPQNSSVISNGKIVDTWATLPQSHMYMESEYILIALEMCVHLSSIIVIKHHKLTMDKSLIGSSRLS
jgi:hypothetical protein